MNDPAPQEKTYLFSDIEGSTRLWETDPQRAAPALARHDAVSRAVVERHQGTVVKMTGDGLHAAFDDPADALAAVIELQQALAAEDGDALPLRVRCGLHVGEAQRRDNDFYGPAVNRAARIMNAAHGGQILVSQAVADRVEQRLPGSTGLRDLGAVRLRDLTGAERLFQVVHPRLRTEFPALRSLASTPNNLPQQLNSFIGREREMREIRALLAANRLVTLQAMGGIGKSRLSVQLAAEVLDEYVDGVWLVELAALSDPREVTQAVASVLGVKEEASLPLADALLRFVAERQLLLILDNCEHLIRACADLAKQLLRAGAQMKILATSRDVLQVAGETVYHLPPLAIPDMRDSAFPDTLPQHESVRLFTERSTATQPSFRLTSKNAPAVVAICRRLDGIPLAIELAAARMRALSPEAIAARLTERFRLLVTGDQTVLPRQRTLRALIDWSYDLLNARERALFERLSVFAGGWTLEAAEVVGSGGELSDLDIIDLQASLVEKSLIVMEADSDRYRMLDTVKTYAQERAEESGEAGPARDRHLAYFVDYAERARAQLGGAEQGAWLASLDAERENLQAAHAWCDSARQGAALGLRLSSALKPYWVSRGLLMHGLRVTVEGLERPEANVRDTARSRALLDAGQLSYFMGRYAEAERYLEESLTIAREIGDEARVLVVLQPLGMAALGLGDEVKAGRYLREAAELAQQRGRADQRAATLNALAQYYRWSRQFDAAQELCEKVLALARDDDDSNNIALALLNLAMVAIERGRAAQSVAMLREAAGIAAAIGSMQAGQSVLEVCTGLAVMAGQRTVAAAFLDSAEAQARRSGLHRDPADQAFLEPFIAQLREHRRPPADAAAADSEPRSGAVSPEEALADAQRWLAELPEASIPE